MTGFINTKWIKIGGDGENVQAQQFEGESKTDESAISISRSLPNRNTSARTNKKTYHFNHSSSKYTNVYLNAIYIGKLSSL